MGVNRLVSRSVDRLISKVIEERNRKQGIKSAVKFIYGMSQFIREMCESARRG
jgi:hypothetical protein